MELMRKKFCPRIFVPEMVMKKTKRRNGRNGISEGNRCETF
jgi:hypothetical protein